MSTRQLYLQPGRFERWWDTFHAEHPGVQVAVESGEVELASTDGSVARFTGWYPVGVEDNPREVLLRTPEHIGIILLRRGGYSVGLGRGGKVVEHKTGTRYVQSRTAAGGWSQQRFARRRSNQADELTRMCADVAARILGPLSRATSAGLLLGGDDLLLAEVLTDTRLAPLAALPGRRIADIPDPRYSVLVDSLGKANAVSVSVFNP